MGMTMNIHSCERSSSLEARHSLTNPIAASTSSVSLQLFKASRDELIPSLENTEVYNILCDSLGIDPLPNNGTLRLPLKPVGLHSDEDTPPLEQPSDPPQAPPTTTTAAPAGPTSPASEASPTADSGSEDEKGATWWGTMRNELNKWKQWAGDLFSSIKDNHPQR